MLADSTPSLTPFPSFRVKRTDVSKARDSDASLTHLVHTSKMTDGLHGVSLVLDPPFPYSFWETTRVKNF